MSKKEILNMFIGKLIERNIPYERISYNSGITDAASFFYKNKNYIIHVEENYNQKTEKNEHSIVIKEKNEENELEKKIELNELENLF